MNIGQSIQSCRIKRHLTLAQLAERVGCSASYLSMLENSRRDPTLSTVNKIANALEIPIEILFFLGAEKGELQGINKELAGQLALLALEILNESSNK